MGLIRRRQEMVIAGCSLVARNKQRKVDFFLTGLHQVLKVHYYG